MGVLAGHVVPEPAAYATRALTAERTWPLTSVLLASTCIVVGLIWDISWHRTIGRDTFWSPPHVIEQVGALVAALTCGWLVLQTTYGKDPVLQAASVTVWGFRGPLGAWVCIWGAVMMATSAPFDNWWHNAYGLDVKILSPPHAVLAIGMIAIEMGALLMALARQNRASANDERRLSLIYAAAAGILITMRATVQMENAAFPNQMHTSLFYVLTALGMPLFLCATARPSRLRWPATTTAAMYMAIVLLMMWILPLFPATPKLAPIYNSVTHMVPPPFPLLLVFPALAIDIVMRNVRGEWKRAFAIGVLFVVVLLVSHWWWAEFLLSPQARNPVFAGDQWDYNIRPGAWQYQFWNVGTSTPKFLMGIGGAIAVAIATSRLGLWIGSGMARVLR